MSMNRKDVTPAPRSYYEIAEIERRRASMYQFASIVLLVLLTLFAVQLVLTTRQLGDSVQLLRQAHKDAKADAKQIMRPAPMPEAPCR